MAIEDIHVLTEDEKKLIVQLREKVKNELPSTILQKSDEDQDLFLVKWLRARELHLENSAKMLTNSLKWREEKRADEVLSLVKLNPFFPENFPYKFSGLDNHGHPVILIPLSFWDFRKVVNNADRLAEFDDFVTYFFETVMANIEVTHKKRKEQGLGPVTQMTVLMDVKSYPYGQLMSFGAIKKLMQMASTYEAHYPEILYRAIFINCPSYFNIFMNFLKPVLAARTMSKLSLYPQIKKWEEDIADLVDPKGIPKQFGGLAEDTDLQQAQ